MPSGGVSSFQKQEENKRINTLTGGYFGINLSIASASSGLSFTTLAIFQEYLKFVRILMESYGSDISFLWK